MKKPFTAVVMFGLFAFLGLQFQIGSPAAENFRPLHDHVLVRVLEAEEVRQGGIIIPDGIKEEPIEGEVLAVGPGIIQDDGSRRALAVAAGNKVLFFRSSGVEFTLDGEELLVIRESDLLGIVE